MKRKILFSSLILIIAAAAIMTIAQTSYAAETVNSSNAAASSSGQLNRHGKFGAGIPNKLKGNKTAKDSNKMTQADRLKKQTAVNAALEANDYNAWAQAVGANSPLLAKINQNNFSQFVQAHQLRKQADKIMMDLGLNNGMGCGLIGSQK